MTALVVTGTARNYDSDLQCQEHVWAHFTCHNVFIFHDCDIGGNAHLDGPQHISSAKFLGKAFLWSFIPPYSAEVVSP